VCNLKCFSNCACDPTNGTHVIIGAEKTLTSPRANITDSSIAHALSWPSPTATRRADR